MARSAAAKAAEAKYDSTHRAQRAAAARARMADLRAKNPAGYNASMREYRRSPSGQVAIAKSESRPERKKYVAQHKQLPQYLAHQTNYRATPVRKVAAWRLNLKHKYGISITDYDTMLAAQNGVCAICHKPAVGRLHVDHDHKTGQVRGLLCRKCNLGIGFLLDSLEILRSAVTYLSKQFKENYNG